MTLSRRRPPLADPAHVPWSFSKQARQTLRHAGYVCGPVQQSPSGSSYFTAHLPGGGKACEIRISDHPFPARNASRKLPLIDISWISKRPLRGLRARVRHYIGQPAAHL